MKFVHMSPIEITKFRRPKDLSINVKPKGCLWFSCGSQWETYVNTEMPEHIKKSYKFKYEADLNEETLLVLKSYKDIKDFTDKYSLSVEGRPEYDTAFINWNEVRKDTNKDGIYVKNARIKKARDDFLWYYSFDICSVAVWGKNAITNLKLIRDE